MGTKIVELPLSSNDHEYSNVFHVQTILDLKPIEIPTVDVPVTVSKEEGSGNAVSSEGNEEKENDGNPAKKTTDSIPLHTRPPAKVSVSETIEQLSPLGFSTASVRQYQYCCVMTGGYLLPPSPSSSLLSLSSSSNSSENPLRLPSSSSFLHDVRSFIVNDAGSVNNSPLSSDGSTAQGSAIRWLRWDELIRGSNGNLSYAMALIRECLSYKYGSSTINTMTNDTSIPSSSSASSSLTSSSSSSSFVPSLDPYLDEIILMNQQRLWVPERILACKNIDRVHLRLTIQYTMNTTGNSSRNTIPTVETPLSSSSSSYQQRRSTMLTIDNYDILQTQENMYLVKWKYKESNKNSWVYENDLRTILRTSSVDWDTLYRTYQKHAVPTLPSLSSTRPKFSIFYGMYEAGYSLPYGEYKYHQKYTTLPNPASSVSTLIESPFASTSSVTAYIPVPVVSIGTPPSSSSTTTIHAIDPLRSLQSTVRSRTMDDTVGLSTTRKLRRERGSIHADDKNVSSGSEEEEIPLPVPKPLLSTAKTVVDDNEDDEHESNMEEEETTIQGGAGRSVPRRTKFISLDALKYDTDPIEVLRWATSTTIKELHLRQKDFSDRFRVSPGLFSNWFNGHNRIGKELSVEVHQYLLKIAPPHIKERLREIDTNELLNRPRAVSSTPADDSRITCSGSSKVTQGSTVKETIVIPGVSTNVRLDADKWGSLDIIPSNLSSFDRPSKINEELDDDYTETVPSATNESEKSRGRVPFDSIIGFPFAADAEDTSSIHIGLKLHPIELPLPFLYHGKENNGNDPLGTIRQYLRQELMTGKILPYPYTNDGTSTGSNHHPVPIIPPSLTPITVPPVRYPNPDDEQNTGAPFGQFRLSSTSITTDPCPYLKSTDLYPLVNELVSGIGKGKKDSVYIPLPVRDNTDTLPTNNKKLMISLLCSIDHIYRIQKMNEPIVCVVPSTSIAKQVYDTIMDYTEHLDLYPSLYIAPSDEEVTEKDEPRTVLEFLRRWEWSYPGYVTSYLRKGLLIITTIESMERDPLPWTAPVFEQSILVTYALPVAQVTTRIKAHLRSSQFTIGCISPTDGSVIRRTSGKEVNIIDVASFFEATTNVSNHSSSSSIHQYTVSIPLSPFQRTLYYQAVTTDSFLLNTYLESQKNDQSILLEYKDMLRLPMKASVPFTFWPGPLKTLTRLTDICNGTFPSSSESIMIKSMQLHHSYIIEGTDNLIDPVTMTRNVTEAAKGAKIEVVINNTTYSIPYSSKIRLRTVQTIGGHDPLSSLPEAHTETVTRTGYKVIPPDGYEEMVQDAGTDGDTEINISDEHRMIESGNNESRTVSDAFLPPSNSSLSSVSTVSTESIEALLHRSSFPSSHSRYPLLLRVLSTNSKLELLHRLLFTSLDKQYIDNHGSSTPIPSLGLLTSTTMPHSNSTAPSTILLVYHRPDCRKVLQDYLNLCADVHHVSLLSIDDLVHPLLTKNIQRSSVGWIIVYDTTPVPDRQLFFRQRIHQFMHQNGIMNLVYLSTRQTIEETILHEPQTTSASVPSILAARCGTVLDTVRTTDSDSIVPSGSLLLRTLFHTSSFFRSPVPPIDDSNALTSSISPLTEYYYRWRIAILSILQRTILSLITATVHGELVPLIGKNALTMIEKDLHDLRSRSSDTMNKTEDVDEEETEEKGITKDSNNAIAEHLETIVEDDDAERVNTEKNTSHTLTATTDFLPNVSDTVIVPSTTDNDTNVAIVRAPNEPGAETIDTTNMSPEEVRELALKLLREDPLMKDNIYIDLFPMRRGKGPSRDPVKYKMWLEAGEAFRRVKIRLGIPVQTVPPKYSGELTGGPEQSTLGDGATAEGVATEGNDVKEPESSYIFRYFLDDVPSSLISRDTALHQLQYLVARANDTFEPFDEEGTTNGIAITRTNQRRIQTILTVLHQRLLHHHPVTFVMSVIEYLLTNLYRHFSRNELRTMESWLTTLRQLRTAIETDTVLYALPYLRKYYRPVSSSSSSSSSYTLPLTLPVFARTNDVASSFVPLPSTQVSIHVPAAASSTTILPYEPLCSLCNDGGLLIACRGPCQRTFHLSCVNTSHIHNQKRTSLYASVLDSTDTNTADDEDDSFYCPDCYVHYHTCDLCGVPGPSVDTLRFQNASVSMQQAYTHVAKCAVRTCGHYYHPACVRSHPGTVYLSPSSSSTSASLVSVELPLLRFRCPSHVCSACGEDGISSAYFAQYGNRTDTWPLSLRTLLSEGKQLLPCTLCPRTVHRSCLDSVLTGRIQVLTSSTIICACHSSRLPITYIGSMKDIDPYHVLSNFHCTATGSRPLPPFLQGYTPSIIPTGSLAFPSLGTSSLSSVDSSSPIRYYDSLACRRATLHASLLSLAKYNFVYGTNSTGTGSALINGPSPPGIEKAFMDKALGLLPSSVPVPGPVVPSDRSLHHLLKLILERNYMYGIDETDNRGKHNMIIAERNTSTVDNLLSTLRTATNIAEHYERRNNRVSSNAVHVPGIGAVPLTVLHSLGLGPIQAGPMTSSTGSQSNTSLVAVENDNGDRRVRSRKSRRSITTGGEGDDDEDQIMDSGASSDNEPTTTTIATVSGTVPATRKSFTTGNTIPDDLLYAIDSTDPRLPPIDEDSTVQEVFLSSPEEQDFTRKLNDFTATETEKLRDFVRILDTSFSDLVRSSTGETYIYSNPFASTLGAVKLLVSSILKERGYSSSTASRSASEISSGVDSSTIRCEFCRLWGETFTVNPYGITVESSNATTATTTLTSSSSSSSSSSSTVQDTANAYVTGPFITAPFTVNGKTVYLHSLCALYTPEVWVDYSLQFYGITDSLKRCQRIKCKECDQTMASIGCFVDRCIHSFHFPCAVQNIQGWDIRKYHTKAYFCARHRDDKYRKTVPNDYTNYRILNPANKVLQIGGTHLPETIVQSVIDTYKNSDGGTKGRTTGKKVTLSLPPAESLNENSLPKRRGRPKIKTDEENIADNEDPNPYCVCQQPDTGEFYINCSSCSQWYHPECIGIDTNEANRITNSKKLLNSWSCPLCTQTALQPLPDSYYALQQAHDQMGKDEETKRKGGNSRKRGRESDDTNEDPSAGKVVTLSTASVPILRLTSSTSSSKRSGANEETGKLTDASPTNKASILKLSFKK